MARPAADLCVIGAGAAGLSVAAGAAQMGAQVVLVEQGDMGGDCLNHGCVPSKALLAAAKLAAGRDGRPFGIETAMPGVDFPAVRAHVREVIAQLQPHDSQERFEGLGVRVLRGASRFTGPDEVEVDGISVHARRFVVASGSRPSVPNLPGLERVHYLTNETVFDLAELPDHLIVIGGGPVGCELGQAFRRLGAKVTLIEAREILPKDDPELVAVLRDRLRHEGLTILEHTSVASVAPDAAGVAVDVRGPQGVQRIAGSHLLLAVGRTPNVETLNLERAGIACNERGISVDAGLRTSNRHVFALGDVAGEGGGELRLTHAASQQASVVLRRALFRLPARFDPNNIPWATYCEPELAHVGLTEAAARAAGRKIEVLRVPFSENDRAVAERDTAGLVKAVVTPRGRILGCSIVGSGAGDLILPWCLAVSRKDSLRALAGAVVPYPTRSEATKRAAANFYAPRLFSGRVRRLVRLLSRL